MIPPKKETRDLARSLVAREAGGSTTSLHTEPATVRVYDRLRRQFSAPVGAAAFQVLASRALAPAKSESRRLSAVQITANGGLRGLGEVESQTDTDAREQDLPIAVLHACPGDIHAASEPGCHCGTRRRVWNPGNCLGFAQRAVRINGGRVDPNISPTAVRVRVASLEHQHNATIFGR
jgi:hypothetical protein